MENPKPALYLSQDTAIASWFEAAQLTISYLSLAGQAKVILTQGHQRVTVD
jgi:hypothetical protein